MTLSSIVAGTVVLGLAGLLSVAIGRAHLRLPVNLDRDPELAADDAVAHLGKGAGLYRFAQGHTELSAWLVAGALNGPRWRGEVLARLPGSPSYRQEFEAADLADLRSEIVVALRVVRRMRVTR